MKKENCKVNLNECIEKYYEKKFGEIMKKENVENK